MDPNAQKSQMSPSPHGLDPQQQAAYDKVMSFTVPTNTSPPTTPQSAISQNPVPPSSPLSSPTSSPIVTPASTDPVVVSSSPPTTITPPSTPPPATAMFSTTPDPTAPSAPGATPAPVVSPSTPTVVINNDVSTSHDTKTDSSTHTAKKKGGSLMPIFLVIGALVFIALYTVIWIRIFHIQVPFLAF